MSRRDPHLDNAKFEFSNLTHRLGLVCFFVKRKSLNYALLAALKKSASNSNKCSAARHKASVTAPSCLQAALAERSIGIERSEARQKKRSFLTIPIAYDASLAAIPFCWRKASRVFKFVNLAGYEINIPDVDRRSLNSFSASLHSQLKLDD